jgi:hypothetical protein
VVAALGHGRSYGAPSHFLARTLPGILQSGLWSQLSRMPPAHTRGLITDVGNDILYGFSPQQILAWVSEAIDRLESHGAQVSITGLPAVGEADISPGRFLFFRSVFFPRCRLSLADVALRAAQIGEGLEELAVKRGLRLVRLSREWYGVDPIHIRPSRWQTAWQEILCGPGEPRPLDRRRREALKLYAMRPEQQWICGVPFGAPQTGRTLRGGGRVWLF